jgi:hypothetical protein
MSFLNNEDSKFLSVRITKKGRNAIAKGNFNIKYFQVGDSEYDYTSPYTGYTGILGTPGQRVFAPFDRESGVKYPYKIDSSVDATTFGVPVQNSGVPEKIRNVMGPAGPVSNYIEYDSGSGTTIECSSESISISQLDGTNNITVSSGATYSNCQYITIALGTMTGSPTPVITGNSNSFIYKISGITGNDIYLDRNLPNLNGLSVSGNARVICNYCENEYNACSSSVDYQGQLNPWSLNVVWGGGNSSSLRFGKPIGGDYGAEDESLTGYSSNVHVSTKELLGYSSTGQTFVDYTGRTLDYPTSYLNSYNEEILVPPTEQRCIAIVHYSQLGDAVIDPERFFKYDDYISYDDSTTNTVAFDLDDDPISDTEYFQVYIPFIYYHRNTTTTAGALFNMGSDDFYIKSTKNSKHQQHYRYLYDEQGIKVGKVFPHNKTIVFDDQELVAILDYRSNRRYTLPAPKAVPVPSDVSAANSLLSGTTGQTVWLSYMFTYSGSNTIHALPCNYYSKITLSGNSTESEGQCSLVVPCQAGFKFNSDSFSDMQTSIAGLKNGYIADGFYALVQLTDTGDMPEPNLWRQINLTSQIPGYVSGLINPTGLTDTTFTITKTTYDAASLFDLETHMAGVKTNYLGDTTFTTEPQFGDEQYFPGSIKLVRASDVEEMRFLVNLSSSEFLETQNPTYVSGATKKVTDIALLDGNKDVMVIAKTSIPVTRTGAQVFAIKLDF